MREIWFESGGTRLFAVEDGDGPVLVMLHGGMADHRATRPVVAPLAARFRVITPHVRGNGRSHDAGPLSFNRLADDVAALLDHLGSDRAIVGGVSGGSGVALRFGLRHPARAVALVLVKPIHAGTERGYTAQQAQIFAGMNALASRALAEGVQVLRPLYANLPEPIREKALAMLEEFDPGSVVATSRFLASGAQPFAAASDLETLSVPTLLVRGDDAIHPSEVSDLYAASIPNCTVLPATTTDVPAAIDSFCASIV